MTIRFAPLRLRRFGRTAILLAAAACTPGQPLSGHNLALTEKAGSRALAEGINLELDRKFGEAANQYRIAARQTSDAETRARALTELADLYGEGLGVAQDPDKQEALLKEAAALNYPNAIFKLAEIYRGGDGIKNLPNRPARPSTARDLLNSIKTEYPYAAALLIEMRRDGQIAAGEDETRKLVAETVAAFEGLAARGDDSAMLALARLYRDGLVGTPDKKKMEGWYRRAIAAGNLAAAIELGRIWARPDSGRPPRDALALLEQVVKYNELAVAATIGDVYERLGNDREAVIWYQKAAADPKPHRGIYLKLAKAYTSGRGLGQNASAALIWYKKAAAMGSVNATEQVIRAYARGIGVAPDPAEADRWMERLFARRPDRIYPMAKLFAAGVEMPQSLPKAFALALRAAENGDVRAMRYVAKAYDKGVGIVADVAEANRWYARAGISRSVGSGKKKMSPLHMEAESYEIKGDSAKAFALYSKLAEQGDSTAMLRVASSYSTGVGATQNIGKAYDWYRRAAEAGNAEAQYHLGLGYARGFGVDKNIDMAKKWLEKASVGGYPLANATLKTLVGSGR